MIIETVSKCGTKWVRIVRTRWYEKLLYNDFDDVLFHRCKVCQRLYPCSVQKLTGERHLEICNECLYHIS